MQDDLIRKIAQQMTEQAAAYTSLESLTSHLISALTSCQPHEVETFARAGETELFPMRSRLLEITSLLTEFSDQRIDRVDCPPIDPDAREQFETAAKELLKSARSFQKMAGRANSLALGGASFASANIQMCGVTASTYRAPVLKTTRGA